MIMNEDINIFRKVVLNFGTGGDEGKRTNALNFLKSILPERKPLQKKAKMTIKQYGIKKNQIIRSGASFFLKKMFG